MSKGALHRKMMQYGIKLTTKHPSETNNNFKKSYLKSFFGKKIKLFTIIYFEIKIMLVLNILPLLGLACLVQLDRQKYKILRNKNSAMY